MRKKVEHSGTYVIWMAKQMLSLQSKQTNAVKKAYPNQTPCGIFKKNIANKTGFFGLLKKLTPKSPFDHRKLAMRYAGHITHTTHTHILLIN